MQGYCKPHTCPSRTVARKAGPGGRVIETPLTLVDTGLATSKNQARTLITQGGAYVNDRREKDVDARLGRSELLFDRYLVLRRGRDYHLVCFE